MGAEQSAGTLFTVMEQIAKREGRTLDQEEAKAMHQQIRERYEKQMDIRYGAARGWIDAIIPPHTTRDMLIKMLQIVSRAPLTEKTFHTGVIQV